MVGGTCSLGVGERGEQRLPQRPQRTQGGYKESGISRWIRTTRPLHLPLESACETRGILSAKWQANHIKIITNVCRSLAALAAVPGRPARMAATKKPWRRYASTRRPDIRLSVIHSSASSNTRWVAGCAPCPSVGPRKRNPRHGKGVNRCCPLFPPRRDYLHGLFRSHGLHRALAPMPSLRNAGRRFPYRRRTSHPSKLYSRQGWAIMRMRNGSKGWRSAAGSSRYWRSATVADAQGTAVYLRGVQ